MSIVGVVLMPLKVSVCDASDVNGLGFWLLGANIIP